jgi:hypothetical protein
LACDRALHRGLFFGFFGQDNETPIPPNTNDNARHGCKQRHHPDSVPESVIDLHARCHAFIDTTAVGQPVSVHSNDKIKGFMSTVFVSNKTTLSCSWVTSPNLLAKFNNAEPICSWDQAGSDSFHGTNRHRLA